MADIHKIIRQHFRIRKLDVLPFVARRGYTRDVLGDLFKNLGFNLGVEIGTHKGKFAKVLCEKNPNLELICVDPWKAYLRLSQEIQDQLYEQTVKTLTGLHAIIIRKTSMEAIGEFKNHSLDFAYIDGNHDYPFVSEDIPCWSVKVKSGGIIAVHDYYNIHWPGVTKAVDGYIGGHQINPWYVTRDRLPTAFWVNM